MIRQREKLTYVELISNRVLLIFWCKCQVSKCRLSSKFCKRIMSHQPWISIKWQPLLLNLSNRNKHRRSITWIFIESFSSVGRWHADFVHRGYSYNIRFRDFSRPYQPYLNHMYNSIQLCHLMGKFLGALAVSLLFSSLIIKVIF